MLFIASRGDRRFIKKYIPPKCNCTKSVVITTIAKSGKTSPGDDTTLDYVSLVLSCKDRFINKFKLQIEKEIYYETLMVTPLTSYFKHLTGQLISSMQTQTPPPLSNRKSAIFGVSVEVAMLCSPNIVSTSA